MFIFPRKNEEKKNSGKPDCLLDRKLKINDKEN